MDSFSSKSDRSRLKTVFLTIFNGFHQFSLIKSSSWWSKYVIWSYRIIIWWSETITMVPCSWPTRHSSWPRRLLGQENILLCQENILLGQEDILLCQEHTFLGQKDILHGKDETLHRFVFVKTVLKTVGSWSWPFLFFCFVLDVAVSANLAGV